jgi:murein DD-endopeptidase MepM/ murein hydrolase activator NlpD
VGSIERVPPARRLRRAAWLALVCSLAILPVAQGCEDPGVRVFKETRGNNIHIFAEPVHLTEVTLTLTGELDNTRSSRPLPATYNLRGRQRVELSVLHPVKAGHWKYRYRYQWMMGVPGGRPDGTAYRLPFAAGGRHRLSQGYGGKYSHQVGTINEHALDFLMPEGTPILAARAGVVIAVRQESDHGGPDLKYKQCGNYVTIRHADGTYGEYLHLRQNGARVRLGDSVQAGQLIALSGNTGYSSEPHLHFVVYRTIDGNKRQTLPVTFQTAAGAPITLQPGRVY